MAEISREKIGARAFEIYQKRGGTHGSDMNDWLQAERELQQEAAQSKPKAAGSAPAPITSAAPKAQARKKK